MLFTSYTFFGFLAVLFVAYYALPSKHRWKLLLLANVIFYLCAGPKNFIYIFVTALTTYFAALQIGKNADKQKAYIKEHKETLSKEEKRAYKEKQKKVRVTWVTLCIVLNVAILAVLKYSNFFILNLNGILESAGKAPLSFVRLALPLGISFYTLQAIGYLVDVFRGTVKAEKNFFKFSLFMTFFPQLIQGPISRFGDLQTSLMEEHPFSLDVVSSGMQRMLWGYFKKLVIADRLLPAVLLIVGDVETYHGVYALVGMFFYTVQLYADFTGGIDITIGIAEALGIRLKENFNLPYFSKSLKEYWRRWHITMCEWFKDYLFYPVSVSKPMQKLSRFSKAKFGVKVGKRLPVYLSSFVVWFTTGLWHGASWNFIVWGLLNWAVLMISEEFEPLYKRFHEKFPRMSGKGYNLFQMIRTFLLVCIMNMFDCYHTLSETMTAIGSMFTAQNWHILWDGSMLKLKLSGVDFAVLLLGTLLMLAVSIVKYKGIDVRKKIRELPYPVRFLIWYGLFLVVLLVGAYGFGYDASQFIYNQF